MNPLPRAALWRLAAAAATAVVILSIPGCVATAPPADTLRMPLPLSCTQLAASYDAEACAESCEQGDAPSCLWVADRLQVERYPEGAAAYLQLGCADGSGAACARLAELAARGRGVPLDFARAAALHQRACAAGRLEGCGAAPVSLRVGANATDPADGARFELAALTAALAPRCAGGEGVACFDLSVAAGLSDDDPQRQEALAALACVLGSAPGCGAAASPRAAAATSTPFERAWLYDQACSRGDGAACQALGLLFAAGEGLPQDLTRAVALYDRACAVGQDAACAELDHLRRTPQPLVSLMPVGLRAAVAARY